MVSFSLPLCCSFDDGDFDDAEEDEGLDDLENPEDVRLLSVQGYTLCYSKKNVSVSCPQRQRGRHVAQEVEWVDWSPEGS